MKKRRLLLVLYDVFAVIISVYLSLLLQFDGYIPSFYKDELQKLWLMSILICLFFNGIFHIYSSMLRFASIYELKKIIYAVISTVVFEIISLTAINLEMPWAWYISYGLVLMAILGGSRFAYRIYKDNKKINVNKVSKQENNVMIVGAGDAGDKVLREIIKSANIHKRVKCFIDDDLAKQDHSIHGVPIVGTRKDIVRMCKKYDIDEIFVAMPSADPKEIADILNICKETHCKLKKLPGIYQLVNGDVTVSKLKQVEVQDLLGRDSIEVNLDDIMGYTKGKVIMVTGGGGSIGSELCRQIAANFPKQLIIVDIYENNAYDIQLELKRRYPDLNLETMIASVRDEGKVKDLFARFRPDIIYHAAAHKHVPLMEDSPNEAVKNNVFGTLNVARAADEYGAEKFILISTDKAVNPTNIMGATKRICEMIVQTINKHSHTDFVAVRFGNVLGSNGSVIPLFKKQIEQGGPVTVTHPEITRFFMTIPEAVSLVLQAGAFAKGGEIFILDMGKPVKIVDLAYNLIKLSGYEPGEDIKIIFTGLRPGEKLYEEILMDEEGLQTTKNKMIHIGKPIPIDEEHFYGQLERLYRLAYDETSQMKHIVSELVPTYHIKENKEETLKQEVYMKKELSAVH